MLFFFSVFSKLGCNPLHTYLRVNPTGCSAAIPKLHGAVGTTVSPCRGKGDTAPRIVQLPQKNIFVTYQGQCGTFRGCMGPVPPSTSLSAPLNGSQSQLQLTSFFSSDQEPFRGRGRSVEGTIPTPSGGHGPGCAITTSSPSPLKGQRLGFHCWGIMD